MTEVTGALPTTAPGAKILLALKALRACETILIQLVEVRRREG
jgi:hypothetical protein